MKVIIVGGVAGGGSCAARLRRLDEKAEILMVERGPFVSYANCGIPYHIGGVIEKESSLLVSNEQTFRKVFAIDCRTHCEAVRISTSTKTLELKSHVTGEVTTEKYDKLVLSPGADPIRPPLPGIDLPGIFSVRTLSDAKDIREWIEQGISDVTGEYRTSGFQSLDRAKRAVVVGGGYIGLEMAENLVDRGLKVTLVEMLDQVMAPLDPECARLVQRHMEKNGVNVELNDAVAGFRQTAGGSLDVLTKLSKVHPADIVILAIGVRPEIGLAKMAGLEIGHRGGIRVDEQMRTSNPDIFAVGDAVEVKDFVTGEWSLIPLAGPANRQGRIAADVINGRDSRFRGTQGTSVIGLFGATVAMTGASEKHLILKVIFRKSDGRLLGAQALGWDGVEKRIDAISIAIQMGATVYDLEEAELCYAPQYGSAKDPVNFAGMVSADVLRGDMPLSHWTAVDGRFLLDVRNPAEVGVQHVPGAVNIPLPELRARLGELPRDREILIICRSAQRAYYATCILLQNGFKASNLSGGMMSRSMFFDA